MTAISRRRVLTPLAAALALFAVPGAAVAATTTVTTDHAVVAGVPFKLIAVGSAAGTAPADPAADADPAVGLVLLPPGTGCAPSYAEVVGDVYSDVTSWTRGDAASEPYRVAAPLVIDKPGTYVACAYFGLEGVETLSADPAATTETFGPVAVPITRPTVTSTVAIDGPLEAGRRVRLVGELRSNAPEQVTFQINDAASACASTVANNASLGKLASPVTETVYGGPERVAQEIVLPAAGSYRLCSYASREGQEGDPDLLSNGTPFLVAGAAPQPPANPAPAPGPAPLTASPDVVTPGELPALTNTVIQDAPAPAITCELSRVRTTIGRSVWVRCPGTTERVGVKLTRKAGRAGQKVRTFQLRVNRAGTAELRTDRLVPGTWEATVSYRGAVIGLEPLVVRDLPTGSAARKTRKATS